MSQDPSTPLMRQYHSIKQQVPNALLMFRLGDFYELFYDDAVTAARELEITLTSRNKEKGEPIPMCGVPYHAAEGYIARLIQKGYRVAICDQMEDPRFAKKLVKREITRIVTPGTATESALLRSHENNYLAAVAGQGGRAGLAHVDISTGEFRATELDVADLAPALENLNAREVLVAEGAPAVPGVRTELEGWVFTFDYAERTLHDHFKLLVARRLRPGRPAAGGGRGRRDSALSARHAEVGARSSGPTLRFTTAPAPWCWTRSRCAIWNWSSRCLPARAGNRRCSTCSIRPPPAWAGACCAGVCSRPSLDLAEIDGRLDAVEQLLKATIARAGTAQGAGVDPGSGAPAGEGDARLGNAARAAGAGAVAGPDSRAARGAAR